MEENRKFSWGEIITLAVIIIFSLAGILTFLNPEIPDWIRGSNNYLDALSGFWKYLVTVLWCIDRILCISVVSLIPVCIMNEIIWIIVAFLLNLYNLFSRIITKLPYIYKIPKSDDLIKNETYMWILFFIVFIITAIMEIVSQPNISIYIYLGISALVAIVTILRLYLKYKDSQIWGSLFLII